MSEGTTGPRVAEGFWKCAGLRLDSVLLCVPPGADLQELQEEADSGAFDVFVFRCPLGEFQLAHIDAHVCTGLSLPDSKDAVHHRCVYTGILRLDNIGVVSDL